MMVRGHLGSLGIDCNNPPAGMTPDEVNAACESQAPIYAPQAENPETIAEQAAIVAKYPCFKGTFAAGIPPYLQPDVATIDMYVEQGLFGSPGLNPCTQKVTLSPALAPVPQSYEQAVASYVENKPNQSVPPSPQAGEVPATGQGADKKIATLLPSPAPTGTDWSSLLTGTNLLIGGAVAAGLFLAMGMGKGKSRG